MTKLKTLPNDVDIISQLGDLKEIDYKNMLVLTSLIELLVEKGIITHNELLSKTSLLEAEIELPEVK